MFTLVKVVHEVKRFIAFMATVFGIVQLNWIRMSNFSFHFKKLI
ncbi:hypothetical protein [Virgibacillus subterraneus]|nr:hypothetical protein [Virgibacillus subterraneus]